MFSPSDFNEDVSVFKDSQGTPFGNYCSAPVEPQYIAEPDHTTYIEGRAPLNTLPAQWWNWLLNQITKKLNGVNKYVGNLFSELSNLLGLMGITPTEPSTPTGNQLSTGFLNSYPNVISKFMHTIASVWTKQNPSTVGTVTTTQINKLAVFEDINEADSATTPPTETDTYNTKYVDKLPVELGGTGANNESDAMKNLVVPLDVAAQSAVQDTDHIVVDIENSSNVHFIKRFSSANLASIISHSISNLTIPIGTVWTTFADTDDTDNHFLICNGRTLSRTTYAGLWNFAYNRNLVRDAEHPNRPFGPGDSSTTFEIPDMRNRTIMGANPDVVGKADGNTSNVGDVQLAQAPNIKGELTQEGLGRGSNPITKTGAFANSKKSRIGHNASVNENYSLDIIFDGTASNASVDHLGNDVYFGDFNNPTEANRTFGELRSANIRMNYIIKY